jgi:hypothetical protein
MMQVVVSIQIQWCSSPSANRRVISGAHSCLRKIAFVCGGGGRVAIQLDMHLLFFSLSRKVKIGGGVLVVVKIIMHYVCVCVCGTLQLSLANIPTVSD